MPSFLLIIFHLHRPLIVQPSESSAERNDVLIHIAYKLNVTRTFMLTVISKEGASSLWAPQEEVVVQECDHVLILPGQFVPCPLRQP